MLVEQIRESSSVLEREVFALDFDSTFGFLFDDWLLKFLVSFFFFSFIGSKISGI